MEKIYEEILRGTASEILNQIAEKKLKGGITLEISGKTRKNRMTWRHEDGKMR
jgi:16S rRNA C1402 (ribose-2'-O) methylase RsmI